MLGDDRGREDGWTEEEPHLKFVVYTRFGWPELRGVTTEELVPQSHRNSGKRKWIGHRLLPEKTVPMNQLAGRKISAGYCPVSEGVQIRVGCKLVGSLFRSLAYLPGDLARFIPCGVGTHLSRLRYLGWLQCGHGLTSRPLESGLVGCLDLPTTDTLMTSVSLRASPEWRTRNMYIGACSGSW